VICGSSGASNGLRDASLRSQPVLEEDPQYLGDDKDHLAVGNIQEKFLPHPLGPLFDPLGMTGGAKSPGTTGKVKEPLFPTRSTPDAGKPAARIAAVEVALHHILDDGSEEAVLSLET
jgi:hypothetical protein